MMRSIFYKEFLKTYKILIPFLFVFIVILVDTLLDARNNLEYYDPTAVVLAIIQKSDFSFNYIDIAMLALGVVLAIFQFYPEVSGAKVRLHLHLPLGYHILVSSFLIYGLGILLLYIVALGSGYYMILSFYYPIEVFWAIFSKLSSIFISSIFLYLATALIFVEPNIKLKLSYFALTVLIMRLYFAQSSGAYFVKKLYYVNTLLDIVMFAVVAVYILTLYAAFGSYKRGYVK